ncbi:MAG TPA: SIR2 family protein [Pyrinomonadaceae bacterium]|nr:SIR2 family protein [Pyrinomonadaceae bacterium]
MVDNETAKRQLVSTLKSRRAVLLAGAGSSKFVGYPRWGELVKDMRRMFAPHLVVSDDMAPMTFANEIVAEIRRTKELPAYYNFLERTFEPRPDRARLHDDLHVTLVQLGFCGLVTTNYEPVIESAVAEAFASDVGPFRCDYIDLCQDRVYRVFDFFRSLATGEPPRWVLHLHGYYRNPHGIILTEEDYRRRYGEHPTYDEAGRAQNVILNSLHRKVLWTLFATHPLVFLGFSLQDGFFVHMLQVVREDFELGFDLTHYALMGYTTEEDKKRIWDYLRRHNTMPIFYHVPEAPTGQEQDHSDLKRLINELGVQLGAPSVSSGVTDITRRMLEL